MYHTLTNSFHGRSHRLRLTEDPSGMYRVSYRQAQESARALCGLKDCTCGDTFGARGGRRLEVRGVEWPGGGRKYYLVTIG